DGAVAQELVLVELAARDRARNLRSRRAAVREERRRAERAEARLVLHVTSARGERRRGEGGERGREREVTRLQCGTSSSVTGARVCMKLRVRARSNFGSRERIIRK